MQQTPYTNWLSGLTQIEQAIAGCLASLEKYEARFQEYLAVQPAPLKVAPVLATVNQPMAEAPNLSQARLEALQIEQLLDEQERVWKQWQETLANWQESVKQATPVRQSEE